MRKQTVPRLTSTPTRTLCVRLSSAHTSLRQQRAFYCPIAKFTVTSNERAPRGYMCPGRRTCVAPLSSRAYAGSCNWLRESTTLAHLVRVLSLILLDQYWCLALEHSAHHMCSSPLGTMILQTKVCLVSRILRCSRSAG